MDNYPGPRGFLLTLSFFIWKFATRSADRSAEPIKKYKKRFASQNLPIKNKRKPLGPGYAMSRFSVNNFSLIAQTLSGIRRKSRA